MIIALEGDEARIGDAMRQFEAFFVRDARIVAAVNNECWYLNKRKTASDVDDFERLPNAYRVLRRGGNAHQFIHPPKLLGSTLRDKTARKDLTECRIVLPPSMKHQGIESVQLSSLRSVRIDPHS